MKTIIFTITILATLQSCSVHRLNAYKSKFYEPVTDLDLYTDCLENGGTPDTCEIEL